MKQRRKRILWVTNGLPYPPHSGFRQHDFHLITQAAQHYSIILCSLLESAEEVKLLDHIRPYCEDIAATVARRHTFKDHLPGVIDCLLSGRPLATHSFYDEKLAAYIREIASARHIDLVQIEHSFFAPYLTCLPQRHACKTVLSFHNLGGRQYRSMLKLDIGFRERCLFLLKWLLMRRWEAQWAAKFDHVLTVSPIEAKLLQAAEPTLSLSVIENGIDTQQCQLLPASSGPLTLLFVGTMGYPPNVDAVLWFCREILPRIQRQIPEVKLLVVGHHPRPEILKLSEQPDIIVTGHVPDVRPYYEQASVCIAPLRAGGGTRLKILEAMALGRPVVSTSLGCEGLHVTHDKELLIADTSSAFAKQVIGLFQSRALREQLAHQARKVVEAQYDWRMIGHKLLKVYEDLEKRQKP